VIGKGALFLALAPESKAVRLSLGLPIQDALGEIFGDEKDLVLG